MREEENQTTAPVQIGIVRGDHPWVEMPAEEDSLDETVRYSMDEIRFA